MIMNKYIYDTKDLTASSLADELFSIFQTSQGFINIAISGGSTPGILFRIISEKYGNSINWKNIRFFWVDERCVPPDDDQSNYKMTLETLFNHIDIPEENILRVLGENEPGNEAVRYSVLIKSLVPIGQGFPSFDIILLGIGDDGHTASIFPDQMNLLQSQEVCETAVHPESGQVRVTLTGKVLNNSKRVFFLVCGTGKKDIIPKIMDKDPIYPASHIIRAKEGIKFYMDAAAAANL